ncbi:DUF1775 domain-containing protein [Actinoplanes subglobosus]|uniref:DUF1775 domain-containing protein n=1 Tax=Actinoplanes subglobosus TaxID=1547892 RepID=A0ABV8J1J7_9ACTN
MSRWLAAAVVTVAAVLVAAPAAAHVRVETGSAPGKGGYGTVRLTVPTESGTASTVGVTVTIPDDVTLASARVLPVDGWTATVETAGRRVTRIVWKAQDKGLGPQEFGIFTFSGGPWPADRSAVPLPTVQAYSDGSSVAWDQVALDASEPEHPAPIVVLGEAAADHHGVVASQPQDQPRGGTDTSLAQWVLIGFALLLSVTALLRRAR